MSNKIRVVIGFKTNANIFSNILIQPVEYFEKEIEVDGSLSTDEIIQTISNQYPKNLYIKFKNITVRNKP